MTTAGPCPDVPRRDTTPSPGRDQRLGATSAASQPPPGARAAQEATRRAAPARTVDTKATCWEAPPRGVLEQKLSKGALGLRCPGPRSLPPCFVSEPCGPLAQTHKLSIFLHSGLEKRVAPPQAALPFPLSVLTGEQAAEASMLPPVETASLSPRVTRRDLVYGHNFIVTFKSEVTKA